MIGQMSDSVRYFFSEVSFVHDSYDDKILACSSMVVELPNDEENSPKLASEKKHGNLHLSDHSCVRILNWKAIAPEPSNGGTPNFQHKVRRIRSVDQRPRPLPVIYVFSASEYQLLTVHCAW